MPSPHCLSQELRGPKQMGGVARGGRGYMPEASSPEGTMR